MQNLHIVKYDLEDKLVSFAVSVIDIIELLPDKGHAITYLASWCGQELHLL